MRIENTAVTVVQNREGKILLVKRDNRTFHGRWCIPGGHSEKEESPEQTAQREANEEIGNVKVDKKAFMIFVHNWPSDSHISEPHRHRCHTFMGKVTGKLKAGDDAAELGWFSFEEAEKMKLTEYTRIILNKLKEK